jgi:hypothetical protein
VNYAPSVIDNGAGCSRELLRVGAAGCSETSDPLRLQISSRTAGKTASKSAKLKNRKEIEIEDLKIRRFRRRAEALRGVVSDTDHLPIALP